MTLATLWLSILVSAILVFFASSLIHMVLPFHRADYGKVLSEDAVILVPCPHSPAGARTPDFIARTKKGLVVEAAQAAGYQLRSLYSNR